MYRKRQRAWPEGAAASSLVPCPVCAKQVPLTLINSHLDTGCLVSGLSPPANRAAAAKPWNKAAASQKCKPPPATQPSTPLSPAQVLVDDAAEVKSGDLHEPPQPSAVSYRLTIYQPADGQQQPADPAVQSVPSSPQTALVPPIHPGDQGKHQPATDLASKQYPGSISPADHPPDNDEDDQAAAGAQLDSQAPQEAFCRQSVLRRLMAGGHAALQGHHTIPNFVSPAEEAALVALVDTCQPAWHDSNFNGKHRGKAWGVRMDLRTRRVIPAKVELPSLLQDLAARMRRDVAALKAFHPTEANAIDYHRKTGHQLKAHVDDRQLSTGEIVTLSLMGACTMTFQTDGKKGASQSVRVHLPPRTLQVLTGKARYSFSHAIHLADLEDERRVSITFRQSPLTRDA